MSLFTPPLNRDMIGIIAGHYQQLMDEVREATRQAGREGQTVQVVAVSKYVDAPTTACMAEAGCRILGENRPQQLWEKTAWFQTHAALGADRHPVQWHLIGHLQRNKVRRTLPLVDLIHSIDSPRLAKSIAQSLEELDLRCDGLLEVNITGEDAKTGMPPEVAREVLESLIGASRLRIVGLMGMAAQHASSETCRRQFASLRNYRDAWQQEFDHPLPELSMGMSGDFTEGIAEGATMIRVGSRLLEGIRG